MSDSTDGLEIPEEHPWRDEELMKRFYVEEKRSANDIRKLFDCSISTVINWVEKHGIEKRTPREAKEIATPYPNAAHYKTNNLGYEVWRSGDEFVLVHRLAMVAEHGFDGMKDQHVHHKNGIRWDNRPENLERVTNDNHQSKHRKFKKPDRLAISALYDATDLSSRDVGDVFDTSNATVLRVHKEELGGEA